MSIKLNDGSKNVVWKVNEEPAQTKVAGVLGESGDGAGPIGGPSPYASNYSCGPIPLLQLTRAGLELMIKSGRLNIRLMGTDYKDNKMCGGPIDVALKIRQENCDGKTAHYDASFFPNLSYSPEEGFVAHVDLLAGEFGNPVDPMVHGRCISLKVTPEEYSFWKLILETGIKRMKNARDYTPAELDYQRRWPDSKDSSYLSREQRDAVIKGAEHYLELLNDDHNNVEKNQKQTNRGAGVLR